MNKVTVSFANDSVYAMGKVKGRTLNDRLESMDCHSLGFMGNGKGMQFVLGQKNRLKSIKKMMRRSTKAKELIKELALTPSALKGIQKMVRISNEIKKMARKQGSALRARQHDWEKEKERRKLRIAGSREQRKRHKRKKWSKLKAKLTQQVRRD